MNEMCIPLLHAAAFDPSIKNVTLVGSPISYRSIVMNRNYRIGLTRTGHGRVGHPYEVDFSWGIAGVLTAYDLPDLIGCIAPRKVGIAGLKDHTLESASADLIRQEMNFPRSTFFYKGVPDNLKIISSSVSSEDLIEWGFE